MVADSELQIERIEAYRYRMPLKRAYGTARGRTTASQNFIVEINASNDRVTYQGFGECQPRHALTGDGEKDRSSAWQFLTRALDTLDGLRLSMTSREVGVQAVRDVMAELSALARDEATEIHGDKPFRGTLLGIEVALLDVMARALGLRLSQLLGEKRTEIQVSISTISTTTSAEEVADKAERQRRFPMTRLKGGADLESNMELLRQATYGNIRAGAAKPLWIDLNEALSFEASREFIRAAAEEMEAGTIPHRLTVEGPLPKEDGRLHADLQRYADEVVAGYSDSKELVIEVMPDESLWDADDLAELQERGGCRALNIKAPKAGGLLASLDLAEAAVAADPQVKICIGGMLGTSELTAWALHNLARAMPRIDYLTTVPPRNVDPIAFPKTSYAARGSSIVAAQTGTGLGTNLDLDKLGPFLEDRYAVGRPRASTTQVEADAEVTLAAPSVEPPSREASQPRQTWRVLVDGPKVASAGYRDWLRALAQDQRMSGWVRNRSDGAVEALIRGRDASVGSVIARLQDGPADSQVARIEFWKSDVVPHAGLRIRDDVVVTTGTASAGALRHRFLSKLRRKHPETSGRQSSTTASASEDAAEVERKHEGSTTQYEPAPGTAARTQPVSDSNSAEGVSLEELGRVLGGEWRGEPELDRQVAAGSFLIDRLPEKALFYMMDDANWSKRLRQASHQSRWTTQDLVRTAAARGAVAAVAREHVAGSPIPVHVVPDTREAMWKLASFARARYTSPVVGITGTVGKSTTTSLLSHVLSRQMHVHSTDGNWNTIDGVSNTLNGLLAPTDVAVVEAAVSGFVRVPEYSSAAMIQPDVAMVTAIGSAHLDIAPTVEDTARIKGKLLENMRVGGIAVLNADAPYFDYLTETARHAGASKIMTFGRSPDAHYRLIDWRIDGNASVVSVEIEGRQLSYRMRSIGEGVAFNSLGTIAAARALGCAAEDVTDAFHDYVAKDDVSALHEIAVGDGTALVIDDSTNATVISMKAAIELLGQLADQRQGRAVAVLGQINFLGERADEIHASLADPLKEAGVKLVLTTGEGMDGLRSVLGPERCGAHAETPRQLVEDVRAVLRPGDVVLVKGSSASTGFKRVARSLLSTRAR